MESRLNKSCIWPADVLSQDEFLSKVYEQGRAHHRDLPWRYIDDPYSVLVSEVMLQQTQVVRVLRYWERWMSAFPTLDALSAASTSDVLEHWQGLGYNRRALALKRCAEICSEQNQGLLPSSVEELVELPGIGPATAGGIMAFAHGCPAVYLETNVRTVFIHELFPHCEKVHDKDLIPLVQLTCPEQDARRWYYALLDYGAHLKVTTQNPSRKSAHYTRQSSFEGSRRQKRAEIVRLVLAYSPVKDSFLLEQLNESEVAAGRERVEERLFHSLLDDLESEGFFTRDGQLITCA